MSDIFSDDYRDLNAPQNFINRSAKERRLAAIYFLKVGAVEAFHERIDLVRRVEPDFIPDLHQADLSNSSLWKANLAKANLKWAQLEWSDLKNANLSGADLTGANLMGADLRHANLTNANLTDADLRGADLNGAFMGNVNLTNAQQGDIPKALQSQNPHYRKPSPPRKPASASSSRDDGSHLIVNSAEGLGVTYTAPKRDYSAMGGAVKNDVDPNEEAKKLEDERIQAKKDQKKVDQKKWMKKKKDEKRFGDKKKQDNKVFDRKKKEQEKFLARKAKEDKNKGKK